MPPALKEIQDLGTHARSRLAASKKRGLSRKERLELYKRFLKTEEHRIRLLHKSGASGLRVAGRRADLLDVILRNLYEDAMEEASISEGKHPLAIIATGGYGRGRLNPCSDVDIHFIQSESRRTISTTEAKMIEHILYMLYDCGFQVGHAVRSIKETIRHANEDHQTKTALIESRFICGDEALHTELRERFVKQCVTGKEKEFLARRIEDLRTRHEKGDNTVYLQEPHVKQGCGGLRDYQNLIWITFVKRGTSRIKDLVDQKCITARAYGEMRKAYDFLLRVRNELHYQQGRSTDVLTLRLQGVVARNFGYPQRGVLRKSEAFMRDYYLHTSNLYRRANEIVAYFQLEQSETESASKVISFLARRKKKEEHFDGFFSRDGHLFPEGKTIFKDNHHRLMRLFQHLQLRHLRVSPELSQLVQTNYDVINSDFRYSRTNRETFEAILSRPGDIARTLRLMHESGVLGRYIPEFGALTNLVQHEFFHRYTADEHTLRVADELDKLVTSEAPDKQLFRNLLNDLEDPYILSLAIILHDTGRAANLDNHDDASAVLADKLSKRMRLPSARRRMLIFLVENHLCFWRFATTRNLDDPRTISDFALIAKSREYLDALFLLTYADSNGTNKEAWTGWKASLMRQLYFATIEYFEDSKAFAKKGDFSPEELGTELRVKLADSHSAEIDLHLEQMPERYFRFRESHMIATHIRLCSEFHQRLEKAAGSAARPEPVLKWEHLPDQGCSRLTVVCDDRPRFLANIAGVLASQKLNIVGADFFVRRDGIVLDIFRVCTTNFEPVTTPNVLTRVEKLLASVLAGDDVDLADRIAKARVGDLATDLGVDFPQRVYINPDASPDYTMVEIQALDRIGLLHSILNAISDLDLEITNARIGTSCGAAIDTLFVVDPQGRKLTDRKVLDTLRDRTYEAIRLK
jgi:[protein-PII] uridylyltransferase